MILNNSYGSPLVKFRNFLAIVFYSKFSNYPNNSRSGGWRNFITSVKKEKDSVTSTEIFPHEAAGPQFYLVLVMHKENSAFEFGMSGRQSVRRCA
jgi:hypothetical protein